MSEQSEALRKVLEEGSRDLSLMALGLITEQMIRAVESGDVSAIYQENVTLDPLSAALLRQKLVAQAFAAADLKDEESREAWRQGLETLAVGAVNVVTRVLFAGLIAL